MIADSNPVGISAQVLKDTFWAIEGGFAVDKPLLGVEVFSEDFKVCGIFDLTETIGKDQFLFFEGIFEKTEELASEQSRDHPDRKKKSSTGWFPGAIGKKSTSRDDTVEVGMIHEVLTPGMENTDEAYGCTEMFWVLGELCQCLGGGAKKQIVQDYLIQ